MKQIPLYLIKMKKIYDILFPSGKILQDLDKKYHFNRPHQKTRQMSPSFKDFLATFGVLCWMFMIKYLLDFLGLFGEIFFFVLIPLSATSHLIGEIIDLGQEESDNIPKISKARIIEIYLLQIIYVGITFFSFRGFIGHTVLANIVAEDIGWASGPFQYELAFYHLGMGIMGMMAIWKRDSIWTGLIYSKSIFLFGAAGVHIWDILVNKNYSHGNTGAVLYLNDLLLPITAIILLHLWLNYKKRELKK